MAAATLLPASSHLIYPPSCETHNDRTWQLCMYHGLHLLTTLSQISIAKKTSRASSLGCVRHRQRLGASEGDYKPADERPRRWFCTTVFSACRHFWRLLPKLRPRHCHTPASLASAAYMSDAVWFRTWQWSHIWIIVRKLLRNGACYRYQASFNAGIGYLR